MANKTDCLVWLGEMNNKLKYAADAGVKPVGVRLLKEAKGFFQDALDAEGNANERDFYYDSGRSKYNDASGYL